jgi:hypothetical protein
MIHEEIFSVTVISVAFPGEELDMPMIATYDTADPLVVKFKFPESGNVTWSVAKSIVLQGADTPGMICGSGDVQILNDADDTRKIILFLSSPDGAAAIKIDPDTYVDYVEGIRDIDVTYSEEDVIGTALDRFLTELRNT